MGERQASSEDGSEPELVVMLARGLGEYRRAVRDRLRQVGFGDLPRSGSWLLVALAQGDRSVGELAQRLSTAKQGISRLSEALVERGYALRRPDHSDHRRVRLSLTPRGAEASAAVLAAVEAVDRAIEERAGRGATERAQLALRPLFGGALARRF